MKGSSWKMRRGIAVMFTSMLIAAPAAQARLDEGAAAAVAPPQPAVHVVDPESFSWEDAGIGAGTALAALAVAGGAAYVVRRRFLPAL